MIWQFSARSQLLWGLAALSFVCASHGATRTNASSPSAFHSERCPDSASSRGPYRVRVRQLSGPDAVQGRVLYSVSNRLGEPIGRGEAQLWQDDKRGNWIGEIPGQPLGSIVRYYFSLSSRAGMVLRHPVSAAATYRFRISGLVVLSVNLPHLRDTTRTFPPATLHLRAASPPSGELVARIYSPGGSVEQRIPMSVDGHLGEGGVPADFELKADLPNLHLGQLAEIYFRIWGTDGSELTVPQEAPALTYKIKRPIRQLQHLPSSDNFVLGLGAAGGKRWMALRGSGIVAFDSAGHRRAWNLEQGIPSGSVRFVLPDETSGRLYVGTNRGTIAIEPGDTAIASSSFAGLISSPVSQLNRMDSRAGPGIISALDGVVTFQVQKDPPPPGRAPARILELREGRLNEWRPAVRGRPLAGLTTAVFDAVEGCALLGALLSTSEADFEPAILRRCGESTETFPLSELVGSSPRTILRPIVPARVVSLARDPASGDIVFALEYELPGDLRHSRQFGVYRLDTALRQIAPLAPETEVMGAEVTSLATDWLTSRLWIATFGKGLFQFTNGAMSRISHPRLPAEVTALAVDSSGTLLAGTAKGVYEMSPNVVAGNIAAVQLEWLDPAAVPGDAVPEAANPARGRVLLSSYSQGLAQLQRAEDGHWSVIERLHPGAELPVGSFGDAKYLGSETIYVAMPSRGLLRVDMNGTKLLGTTEGLHGVDILRLLTRPSGETWVSYTPQPFGTDSRAAVEVLREDQVINTIPLVDRDLATIGRWVDVPERNSVFAATRAGVVEFQADGSFARVSINSASSIARDPATGSIGVVGTSVERWDGRQFLPVLFALDYPGYPKGQFPAGSPFDVAIDRTGIWYLLYQNGILALLDPDGRFLGVLGPEDGMPATSRALLADPQTGDVFVGSGLEGIVVVIAAKSQPERKDAQKGLP